MHHRQERSFTLSGSATELQQHGFEEQLAASGGHSKHQQIAVSATGRKSASVQSGGTAAQMIQTADGGEKQQQQQQRPSAEAVISRLLCTLNLLKMSNPEWHQAAVRRLQDLEEELRTAGVSCPPDSLVSSAVTKALAAATSPKTDVQIRVNSSRHSTTTKSVFETETPGMEGLDPHTVQRLQQQLISNMMTDQKQESMAEGFTSEDGSVVVSKKMTRVVTTTRTTLPGDLIRLKVNENVYSGSVDPGDQHIHLVPVSQQKQ
ncbi:unnamed protein product [Gongylonema pulchrum]|uniref:Uncharacterized protein n=1 Tax=Gongylonema pulchrum TaxID=637853 RepID=A0A183E6S2_9BILA|nr:unnamed protein product [Gongylonema pulchrum]